MRASRRSLLSLLMVILLVGAAGTLWASVAAFDTPLAAREIKACVLGANSRIFINLGRASFRPGGWSFVNPLAPADGTNDGSLNWLTLRDDPAYWNVATSPVPALTDMDVIVLPVGNVSLADELQDALLEAVENGAMLWIDQASGTAPGITNLQPPRTRIQTGTNPQPFIFSDAGGAAVSAVGFDPRCDLLNHPFALEPWEINLIGVGDNRIVWPHTDGAGWLHQTDVDFQPVVTLLDAGGADIGFMSMAAAYGNGAILVTSNSIGARVNGWTNRPGPDDTQAAVMKFAYNAISWLFQMQEQGPAGDGGAPPVIKAPVEAQWQYPAPDRLDPNGAPVVLGPVMGSPVQVNGRVLALTSAANEDGRARLVCLDAEPGRDLCGPIVGGGRRPADPVRDGEPDDGLVDYSLGSHYDLIWEHVFANDISPKSSSLVSAYVADTPVVICATSDLQPGNGEPGMIWCFNAATGAILWQFTVTPYNAGSARVCDISTPAVCNGWVYFLASEYDSALLDPSGVEIDRTYGRAWCIDLRRGGQLDSNPAISGAIWSFPDPDLDRGGAATLGEPQRILGCFNNPLWVAAVGSGGGAELPPLPTAPPVITPGAKLADGTVIDSLMLCGSPVNNVWAQDPGSGAWGIFTANWQGWYNPGGGSDYALAPTAVSGTGTGAGTPFEYPLNEEYFSCMLNASHAGLDSASARRLGDNPPTYQLASAYDTANTDVAHFRSVNTSGSGARQFLANWFSAPAPGENPLDILKGCAIEIEVAATTWESYHLPGPIVWRADKSQFGTPRTGNVAQDGDILIPEMTPVQVGTVYPPIMSTPSTVATVQARDAANGRLRRALSPFGMLPPWTINNDYDARLAMPVFLSSIAADDDTVVASVAQWRGGAVAGNGWTVAGSRSSVVGMRQSGDYAIHLGPGIDDTLHVAKSVGAVEVALIECTDLAPALIPPSAFTVDVDRRILSIKTSEVSDVGVTEDPGGTPADRFPNPIGGKAVSLRWLDTDGNWHGWETHRFPASVDFAYVPGYIKLPHYPVAWNSVVVRMRMHSPVFANHVPVMGVLPGEPLVQYNCGAGAEDTLANGWLDLRGAYADFNSNGAQDAGEPFVAGLEVEIAYTGFHDQAKAFVGIPNLPLGLDVEVQQVPVAFGPSLSGPTVAGKTVLLGTEGFDPLYTGTFQVPGGGLSEKDTLLALNWDAAAGKATGHLTAPAEDASGAVPVVSAPVSVFGDHAVVGSRTLSDPTPAGQLGHGYISMMSTERTLIAAGSRIVECVGATPVRTITSTRTLDDADVRNFGHIAKVTRLDNGRLLVVDSGANQVLEIDEEGRRLWTVGAGSDDPSMFLDRPTDAWRYYSHGGQWAHTVIADTGHRRIIEVVQKPTSPTSPPTTISVYVVSPETVPVRNVQDIRGRTQKVICDPALAQEFLELDYQKAQPILDPETGELWGYLACAANWNTPLIIEPPRFDGAGNFYPARVNPPAGTQVLGASIGEPPFDATATFDNTLLPNFYMNYAVRSWMPWAFVYDLNMRNIRQVEYVRYGDALFNSPQSEVYVWAVASAYIRPPTPLPNPLPVPISAGVYEWRMPVVPPAVAQDPGYGFTTIEYGANTIATFTLPSGNLFTKDFFPTSAHRLDNGDYLISNLSGVPDNFNVENTDMLGWGRVFGSEVFRVSSDTNEVFFTNVIPDPRKLAWPEPLGMVTYAERF